MLKREDIIKHLEAIENILKDDNKIADAFNELCDGYFVYNGCSKPIELCINILANTFTNSAYAKDTIEYWLYEMVDDKAIYEDNTRYPLETATECADYLIKTERECVNGEA